MRRILTIGHSYAVAENRRLAHEMARVGGSDWDVTVVAPARYAGDLRVIDLEPIEYEACALETAGMRWQRVPHLATYTDTRVVSAGPWDVVHCWEEPYVRAGAQVARVAPSSAVFVPATFQNLDKRYPWPLRAFEQRTMSRADGWIAFGDTVRDTLAPRTGYASRPVRVIPPGVDVERFQPDPIAGADVRRALGWQEEDAVVGFLGRFIAAKGLTVLREALEKSQSRWRALFVGGGPMERELHAFAARFPGRVQVITGVRHHDVPKWLNAMTILCAPSQTTAGWREQFGRMLIEGMACGVPLLASTSGEMPFVVGEAGVTLPESDSAAWSAAIDGLLADEVQRRERAAKGIARARSTFAWSVVARQHLDFFEALLTARRTR